MAQTAWRNTTLVKGSLAGLIARLKAQPGQSIGIQGSPSLVQALLHDGLIDELRLAIPPVIAGTGQRLFDGNTHIRRMRLAHAQQTSTGAMLHGITRSRHDPPVRSKS